VTSISVAHLDLLDRIWAVRDNVSAYVGTYIALAEALDATLVTCDAALEKAPGHSARIEVIVLAGLTELEGQRRDARANATTPAARRPPVGVASVGIPPQPACVKPPATRTGRSWIPPPRTMVGA
jgi:hypothetical protein